ncbi:MAG: AAA family ATPase [Acidimicrobiia bacterium]|nr:AAA family ATPase [Acidimicrobiia bacterium]
MSDLPPSSPPVRPGPPQYPGGTTVVPATSEIWEPPKPAPKARRPVPIFDRVKILAILAVIFVFLFWRLRSEQPAYTFGDALITQLQRSGWILTLALIEVVRQLHYLISEQNARYNHFWAETVWGGLDRWKDRRDPWLRYRTARYTKFAAAYLIFSAILANRRGVSSIEGVAAVPGAVFEFLTVGPQQVPFWVSMVFPLLFIVGQFGFLFFFLSRGGVDVYMPEDVTTTFDDVWGQDHVLEKVKENVLFLENPRLIEERGGHVPGGILLWGPPGTGKTLMAEAVAGQTGKPYVFVDPGAFINMFMGVGILKVKSLFRKLRKLSLRYGGVIVFFDEADSLGNRGALAQGGGQGMFEGPDEFREHMRWLSPNSQGLLFDQQRKLNASRGPEEPRSMVHKVIVGGMGGGGGTLQSLLSEISGLKKPRGFLNRYLRRFLGLRPKPPLKYRILVMMATNLPEALDEALLRPGRIDRLYKVGYPSKDGRRRTYEGYLRKVRHQLTPEQIEKLAVITPYATGATIKDMVNEALINALRNGRDAVTWEDIIWAKHFKALGPSEDVEYVERDRHSVAIHEACHAVTAYRVRHHWTIDLATIEKGGNYLGMVSSVKPEDRFKTWKSEYEADLLVSLASLAGERLFFDGDNASGVAGDLQQATALAASMEGDWGMGQTIASHAVSRELGLGGGGGAPKPGVDEGTDPAEALKGPLGERIEGNLARIYDVARQLLIENWYEVLSVGHALETHKTLAGDDVAAVIDGVQGPLVDGRIYHTQQMREQMVAYHELVLTAHRQHGKVQGSLPPALPYHMLVNATGPAVEVTSSSLVTPAAPFPTAPQPGWAAPSATIAPPQAHPQPPYLDPTAQVPPAPNPVATNPMPPAQMAPPPPAGPPTVPAPALYPPPPTMPPPTTALPTVPPAAAPPLVEPPTHNGGAYTNGGGPPLDGPPNDAGANGTGINGNGSHDGGGAPAS